ncbi:hypothetical protein [Paenibacillus montanisoli]|uniref:Uncharacterized protein n=1 Tax=Paenibacillus montanisoli TaxID=2081970 RepID=A0A328TXL9_9BACL|nr:hypothetical protein [Paenibacillus montanisoli]RAP75190.1 hypothetical protein DL346_17575 [Paenibacillus montanisoli]
MNYYYGYPSASYAYPYWIGYADRSPSPDPADVTQFKHSASQFLVPTLEMYHLLNLLAHSPDLATEIKEAASKSDHKKVESLIRSSGFKTPVSVSYNPEGLQVTLSPLDSNACFAIRLSLCW